MSEPADSPASCPNCAVVLAGPFCHQCGQKRISIIRFFDEVAVELLNNNFGYDARLWRTIRQLLLRPGQVARDYVDGKRARFVSPIRLFIAVSIAFVFVEQLFFEPEGWLTFVGAAAGRIGDQIFSETAAAYLAAAQANPAFFQETFLSSLTLLLMPLLPINALVLKALFYKRRPLYMEHLVFLL